MAGLEYSARLSAKSLRELYKDASAAPGVMQIELRRGVKKAGVRVQHAVQESAGSFSKQIPPKIKLKVSFARKPAVKIIADDPSGEAAALNNRGKAGMFRHPVFAHPEGERNVRSWRAFVRLHITRVSNPAHNWVWVSQVAHPFFVTAAHPAALAAADEIRAVMDDIARRLDFH